VGLVGGALTATPWVTADRVYIAAVQDTGLQPTGAIHCLDRATLKTLWTFDDKRSMLHMFSSPVVADGRLFVGEGMHANFECRLYCLDTATGQKLWTHSAGSHIESTPVIIGNRVIVGAGDDGVICLDVKTGEQLWRLERPAHVDTTPVLGDGVVYVGSGISRRIDAEPGIFALDVNTGRVIWHTKFDLPVWATPALTDGILYVGLGNGRLLEGPRPPQKPAGAIVALDAMTGHVRWRYSECDAVFGAPAVDKHNVYFGSRDCHAYALDRKLGERAWAVDCDSPVVAGPVWAGSTLVVAASDGRVSGLDATTGAEHWRFDMAAHTRTKPRILASPAVASLNGKPTLYVAAELRLPAGNAAALFVLQP
jgi:outer membrane protein assembly factor BamB